MISKKEYRALVYKIIKLIVCIVIFILLILDIPHIKSRTLALLIGQFYIVEDALSDLLKMSKDSKEHFVDLILWNRQKDSRLMKKNTKQKVGKIINIGFVLVVALNVILMLLVDKE